MAVLTSKRRYGSNEWRPTQDKYGDPAPISLVHVSSLRKMIDVQRIA